MRKVILVVFAICGSCTGLASHFWDTKGSSYPLTEDSCDVAAPKHLASSEYCSFENQNLKIVPKSCKHDTPFIIMFSCCLENLDAEQLDIYRQIECVDFAYNKLILIPNRVFQSNSLLKRIWMANNQIVEVEREAFYGLFHLEEVDLSNNKLRTIQRSTFLYLPMLKILRLDGNLLERVDFINPSLEYLSLSNNNIRQWSSKTLSNLTLLILSHNRLRTWNSDNSNPNLKLLDLSCNSITVIEEDAFISNQKLVSLNLGNNLIETLDKDTFKHLCHLRILNLSSNKLAVAHSQWFAVVIENLYSGTDLKHIGIENNLWICDCELAALLDRVQHKILHDSLQRARSSKLFCLKDEKKFNVMQIDFEDCPKNNYTTFPTGICRRKLSPISSINSAIPVSLYVFVVPIAVVMFFVVIILICKTSSKQKSGQNQRPQTMATSNNGPCRLMNDEHEYMNREE